MAQSACTDHGSVSHPRRLPTAIVPDSYMHRSLPGPCFPSLPNPLQPFVAAPNLQVLKSHPAPVAALVLRSLTPPLLPLRRVFACPRSASASSMHSSFWSWRTCSALATTPLTPRSRSRQSKARRCRSMQWTWTPRTPLKLQILSKQG
eukprot:171240-Chlamydomonas_euryale.AAC.6